MPGSVTETILREHVVEGELTAGSEIAIRIDHALTGRQIAILQAGGLLNRARHATTDLSIAEALA